jgi:hypothetical protein
LRARAAGHTGVDQHRRAGREGSILQHLGPDLVTDDAGQLDGDPSGDDLEVGAAEPDRTHADPGRRGRRLPGLVQLDAIGGGEDGGLHVVPP